MTHLAQPRWHGSRNVVTTMQAAPGDVFVFVLINGKTCYRFGINEYLNAVQAANQFALSIKTDAPVVIKVIPMSLIEAQALGLIKPDIFKYMTAEQEADWKTIIRHTCTDALQNEADPEVRTDALRLLQSIGGI